MRTVHSHAHDTRLVPALTAALLGTALGGCGGAIAFTSKSPIAIVAARPGPLEGAAKPRVELRDDRIEIREKVQFDFDRATIKQVSHSLLDEVAALIKKNPQLKKVEVAGHASAEGEEQHNLWLSDARANAVMAYLVEHGVAKEMLAAKGYGITQPLAENTTEEGREKNRRVEFRVTEQETKQKRVEIDPRTGTERVLD